MSEQENEAAADAEANRTVEHVWYTGRRMLVGNKVAHEYLPPSGEALRFSQPLISGLPVGTKLEITLTPTGGAYRSGSRLGPKIIQGVPHPEAHAQWSAADRATATMLAELALERKRKRDVAKHDPVEEALDIIADAMNGLRSIAERAAFTKYVEARIHRQR